MTRCSKTCRLWLVALATALPAAAQSGGMINGIVKDARDNRSTARK